MKVMVAPGHLELLKKLPFHEVLMSIEEVPNSTVMHLLTEAELEALKKEYFEAGKEGWLENDEGMYASFVYDYAKLEDYEKSKEKL